METVDGFVMVFIFEDDCSHKDAVMNIVKKKNLKMKFQLFGNLIGMCKSRM